MSDLEMDQIQAYVGTNIDDCAGPPLDHMCHQDERPSTPLRSEVVGAESVKQRHSECSVPNSHRRGAHRDRPGHAFEELATNAGYGVRKGHHLMPQRLLGVWYLGPGSGRVSRTRKTPEELRARGGEEYPRSVISKITRRLNRMVGGVLPAREWHLSNNHRGNRERPRGRRSR